METRPTVFIGYTRDDKDQALGVYQQLAAQGMQPWMDIKDLLPGQQWQTEISKAIRKCDFVLVCCTTKSVNKSGYLQKEIKEALEIWKEKNEDDIYFIPGRLEDCDLPESLRSFHWVDLFTEEGWSKLIITLESGAERRLQHSHSAGASEKTDEEASQQSFLPEPVPTQSSLLTQLLELPILSSLQELIRLVQDLSSSERVRKDSLQPELLTSVKSILEAIACLEENPMWDKDLCVCFISNMLVDSANKSATQLKQLIKENSCTLEFQPTAAAITSALLSEHMRELGVGDYYCVVSDLASWRDEQLQAFRNETKRAVEKGVNVRRVFNLLRGGPTVAPLTPANKREILQQHLEDAKDWTGPYEVRVFSTKSFDDLKNSKPQARKDEQEIKDAHFGVFGRAEGETMVEYEVKHYDLSKMNFQKGEASIRQHLQIFEEIWQVASPLTQEIIKGVTRRS